VGTGELVRQRQVQGFNVGLEAYRWKRSSVIRRRSDSPRRDDSRIVYTRDGPQRRSERTVFRSVKENDRFTVNNKFCGRQ
jgi:hypothetical protein